ITLVKKESARTPVRVFSTPLKYLAKPRANQKVWSVGGMSSLPWMRITGIHPGYPIMPRPELHESTLYLFWVGGSPR
ncbi:MAG: hypothetical protein ACREE6_03930, partial [Limisphaerales bacterium]